MPQETKRIHLVDEEGQSTGRWFNPDSATKYEETSDHDGRNFISRATGSQWEHEQLYRTTKGRWILNHWSQWQGSGESYTEITPKTAAAWLIRCRIDPPEDLSKYVEESEV
jgi:hypothetical protein